MNVAEVKPEKTKKKVSPIIKMWQDSQAIREALEKQTPIEEIEKALDIRFVKPI